MLSKLNAFIKYLEDKPADKGYHWYDCMKCMMADYGVHAYGIERPMAFTRVLYDLHEDLDTSHRIGFYIGSGVHYEQDERAPEWKLWTYGQALARAIEMRDLLTEVGQFPFSSVKVSVRPLPVIQMVELREERELEDA